MAIPKEDIHKQSAGFVKVTAAKVAGSKFISIDNMLLPGMILWVPE